MNNRSPLGHQWRRRSKQPCLYVPPTSLHHSSLQVHHPCHLPPKKKTWARWRRCTRSWWSSRCDNHHTSSGPSTTTRREPPRRTRLARRSRRWTGLLLRRIRRGCQRRCRSAAATRRASWARSGGGGEGRGHPAPAPRR